MWAASITPFALEPQTKHTSRLRTTVSSTISRGSPPATPLKPGVSATGIASASVRRKIIQAAISWAFLSEGITSWVISWRALSAQLPFENKSKTTNLMALFLAVRSPSLITYSLALTILNARWVNRTFRRVKEINTTLHRPQQLRAIKAARAILIETQHVPVQISNGPRRELAQLIVCPKNWVWWCSLREKILITKRKWTYPLYALG